jgi:hypothetical protein
MIFHSPVDAIVEVKNARWLFEVARHPKSFVSLDRADHLLSRHADATYVARALSAWALALPGRRRGGHAHSTLRCAIAGCTWSAIGRSRTSGRGDVGWPSTEPNPASPGSEDETRRPRGTNP